MQTDICEVGQHAGIMGQHKKEWWVNMARNLQIWANNGEKYVLVEDYEPGLCLPESEEICVVQEVDNQPQIGSEFSYSEANEFLSEAEIAPLENSEEGVYQGF